jgi:hypothetical protein
MNAQKLQTFNYRRARCKSHAPRYAGGVIRMPGGEMIQLE